MCTINSIGKVYKLEEVMTGVSLATVTVQEVYFGQDKCLKKENPLNNNSK